MSRGHKTRHENFTHHIKLKGFFLQCIKCRRFAILYDSIEGNILITKSKFQALFKTCKEMSAKTGRFGLLKY